MKLATKTMPTLRVPGFERERSIVYLGDLTHTVTNCSSDWQLKLDQFLEFNDRDVLPDTGQIYRKEADKVAHENYKQFADQRRITAELEAENDNFKVLENIEKNAKFQSEKNG